jgi:hypothetical protein
MKRYKKVYLPYFFMGAIILLFILGPDLTRHTFSSGSITQDSLIQTTNKPIRIDNKTSAFEVIAVERLERNRIRLTLKNNFDKGITAFSISLGDYSVEPDLFPEMIASGQTRVETCTLPPVKEQENVVEISCVIFDDETSEGNSSPVDRIKESRLGSRLAATSMQPYLKQISDASDQDLMAALREARFTILNIPRPQKVQPDSHTEGGFNSAKELVLINLKDLLSESPNRCDIACLRRRLSRIEQREYHKMISPRR